MKTILMDVDTEKFVLSTIDGQEYYVEPGDITICCIWMHIPMTFGQGL